MNLYLFTRKATYDEHGGFVVAAEDEAAARAIVDERAGGVTWEQVDEAQARGDYGVEYRRPTWHWDESAAVECIGTAAPHIARGILLEDFNAG